MSNWMDTKYTNEELESNKLICEFLGAKCEVTWKNKKTGEETISVKSPLVEEWRESFKNTGGYEYSMMLENTRFHNDWNWVMYVVEHITKMNGGLNFFFKMDGWCTSLYYFDPHKGYDEDDLLCRTTAPEVSSLLESVYQTVIRFILWYNSEPWKAFIKENK